MTLFATLIGSLLMLTIAAEFLVRFSSALALELGISPLFVGLTIVGFGTSSPEIAASLSATLRGVPEVGVSNLIGSNIFNVGMIIGITALVLPITVVFERVKRDLVVAVGVAVVPITAYWLSGPPERIAGVVAVSAMIGYVVLAYKKDIASTDSDNSLALQELGQTLHVTKPTTSSVSKLTTRIALIIVSLGFLIGSSSFFVSSATELARNFGVSDRVIGLTIVAGGTSLPELVTSLMAVLRKSGDIAVGNVVGSNIFNVLGILGLCMIVGPQTIPASTVMVDVPLMVFFSGALIVFARSAFTITRVEGAFLMAVYIGYSVFIISFN